MKGEMGEFRGIVTTRPGGLCLLTPAGLPPCACAGGFFFFIFKKIKISKIYVCFGKFQKYTPVALWGATGFKCNFFSSNLQRSPWRKKKRRACRPQRATGPCRPPQGRPTSGPSLQAPGGPIAPPAGDRGACHLPPRATGVSPLIKAPALPFPPHLSPKIPPKIQKKKRGVRRRKAAKPCRIQHL